MGWKRVKEAYGIRHIVHVVGGNLQIGSPYISDLIVIAPDGSILKAYDRDTGDLARYHDDISADPAKFARLFAEKDEFARSIPVYTYRTYKRAEIIELECEEFGWPRVTHDGRLMYDNTYFLDRDKAIVAALKDAAAGVDWRRDRLAELRKSVAEAAAELTDAEDVLATFQGIADESKQ